MGGELMWALLHSYKFTLNFVNIVSVMYIFFGIRLINCDMIPNFIIKKLHNNILNVSYIWNGSIIFNVSSRQF